MLYADPSIPSGKPASGKIVQAGNRSKDASEPDGPTVPDIRMLPPAVKAETSKSNPRKACAYGAGATIFTVNDAVGFARLNSMTLPWVHAVGSGQEHNAFPTFVADPLAELAPDPELPLDDPEVPSGDPLPELLEHPARAPTDAASVAICNTFLFTIHLVVVFPSHFVARFDTRRGPLPHELCYPHGNRERRPDGEDQRLRDEDCWRRFQRGTERDRRSKSDGMDRTS